MMGLRFAWAWNNTGQSVYYNDTNLWTTWPFSGGSSDVYPNETTTFTGPLGFTNYSSFAKKCGFRFHAAPVVLDIPGAAITAGYFQSRFRYTRSGNPSTWFALRDSGGTARVSVTSSPSYGAYSFPFTLVVDGSASVTTSASYNAGTEYHVAIAWDGTAQTGTLYINHTQVATATGVGGAFSVSQLYLQPWSFQNTPDRCDLDGITIWDSSSDDPTRPNIYVLPSLPTTDVTTTNWTSTGANFHDELADGSASTYAESTTTPSTGNLEIGVQTRAQIDSGLTGGTIYGVGVEAATQGDGTLTSVEVGLNSNGTSSTTSGYTTSVSTGWAYHLSTVDPDTSSAWTGSAFDAVTTLFEGS